MAASGVFRRGIRRLLFVLSVAMVLPLVALSTVRAWERRRAAEGLLSERALATATRAAQWLDDDITRSRLMLESLARLVNVSGAAPQNDSLIRGLFGTSALGVSNVWISDTLGRVRGALVRAS